MNPTQVIRIVLALAVIFAAGVLTGRFTAPPPPILMSAPGLRMITSDDVLARVTAELGLDEEQKKKVRPIIEDMSTQMAVHPPGSSGRRDILVKNLPRIKDLLRPDQHEEFERYAQDAERRMERLRRRIERQQRGGNLP